MFGISWASAFRKRTGQWRYNQIKEMYQAELPFNRTWRLVQMMLTQLDLQAFARYTTAEGFYHKVRTPYVSIDAYTERMVEINKLLMKNESIPTAWVNFGEFEIFVDNFFHDEDNRYQEVLPAMAKFLAAGVKLCEITSAIEDSEEGVANYNERLLTRLFMKLKDTLFDLLTLQNTL